MMASLKQNKFELSFCFSDLLISINILFLLFAFFPIRKQFESAVFAIIRRDTFINRPHHHLMHVRTYVDVCVCVSFYFFIINTKKKKYF